jgi:hypothetical protein
MYAEAALMCDPTPSIRMVYPPGGLFIPSSALFNQAALDLLGTCTWEASAWVSMAKEPPFLHHAYALPRMLLALHANSTGMVQTAFRGVYVQRQGKHCTPPLCSVDPLSKAVTYRPFAATELVRYEHYRDGQIRSQTVYFLDIRWPGEAVKAVMVAGEPYPTAVDGTVCPDDFVIDLGLLQGSTQLLITCPGEFSEVKAITAAVQARNGSKGGMAEDMPASKAIATALTPAIVGATSKLAHPWPSGPCWVLPSITAVTLEQARRLLAQAEASIILEGRSTADMEHELQQGQLKQRVLNDHATIMSNTMADMSGVGFTTSPHAGSQARAWSNSGAPAPAAAAVAVAGAVAVGAPAPATGTASAAQPCCTTARLLFSVNGVELHCPTGLQLRLVACTAPVFSWLAVDRYEAALAVDLAGTHGSAGSDRACTGWRQCCTVANASDCAPYY